MGLRVYELAKEIGKDSKYILLICHDLNMTDVENHMNVLEDEQEDRIREYMGAPPAVHTPESEKPKKKRVRTTKPRKKAKAKLKEKETAEPSETAAEKVETPSEVESAEAAVVTPEEAIAEVGKVEKDQEAPVVAQEDVLPAEPVEAEAIAGEEPPTALEPRREEEPPSAPGEITDADRAEWRKKGRKALDWTPQVRITGSAAVGRISLPSGRTPEAAPPTTQEPSSRQMPLPGPTEERTEGKEQRGRRGKKVFVPQKDQVYGDRRPRSRRRMSERRSRGAQTMRPAPVVERPSSVEIDIPATVKSLSEATGIKAGELLKKLMETGAIATINDTIDSDVIELLGAEFNVEIAVRQPRDLEEELLSQRVEDRPEDLVPRAPIVVFLGHVDHGKTSLLDAIRKSRITESEAGGITQHFSAYKVGNVVFLDTPGHEAFTEMRARGANVTDIAVLVVAADDGIMPQTEEAINHARAAEVPIVVAINKIDKPEADVMRVKGQLAALELAPEEWGGKTIVSEVSAITGEGVPGLLEMLALEAELLELKANPRKAAAGTVLEAELSEGRGIVANILVQEGTLRRGDIILCGAGHGKVRDIRDDQGHPIEEAPPATPVEIWGLSEIPEAGDRFFVVEDLSKARQIAQTKQRQQRMRHLAERHHVTLENLFARIEEGKAKELLIVLKADVKGSLEAISSSLLRQATDEVKVRILHAGVGGISESDVILADASDAIILGFGVSVEDRARHMAEDRHVEMRLYDVIYQMISDVRQAMEGMLEPEEREILTGHASVVRVFRISRIGVAAGCRVSDGTIGRSDRVRLVREGRVVHTSEISSLRREKDDAREVREGFECGIKILGFDDVKVGDVIETFHIEQVARKLER